MSKDKPRGARSLLITPDEASLVFCQSLEDWQKHVGGYVEAKSFRSCRGEVLTLLVNEDRRSLNLPINRVADRIAQGYLIFGAKATDLYGPALFVGPANFDGETQHLPWDDVIRIFEAFNYYMIRA